MAIESNRANRASCCLPQPLAGNTLTVLCAVDDEVRFEYCRDWAVRWMRGVLQCVSAIANMQMVLTECFDGE